MTDYKINKRLAELLRPELKAHKSTLTFEPNKVIMSGKHTRFKVDYCNNPADIMPLVIEHNIIIEPMFCGDYFAYQVVSYTFEEDPIHGINYQADRYYKAAALCLIKILEGKRDD